MVKGKPVSFVSTNKDFFHRKQDLTFISNDKIPKLIVYRLGEFCFKLICLPSAGRCFCAKFG